MALIIPVFIPHEGCPHSCVFCNQHSISGRLGDYVTPSEVERTIETWLERSGSRADSEVQVAFFGGSFTGLAQERQRELLAAVKPYRDAGLVDAVRLSTRPDYIDRERVKLLLEYGVTTVELGVQSMDEEVLRRAIRGHSAGSVETAVSVLRRHGMQVGLQLMLGLPGQSFTSLRRTLQRAIALEPDLVRIYPVLVVKGSRLEELYSQGKYRPLSLNRAVLQAAYMKKHFDQNKIRVIRMGLQPGESLERSLVAGPYHPAFGELVQGRIMLGQTRRLLAANRQRENLTLVINPRDMSVFRGIRSCNMHRLSELGLLEHFSLRTDETVPRGRISLKINEN